MRDAAIGTVGRLLRTIPAGLPGKTRAANRLVGLFGPGPAVVEGAFGLVYQCPSLAEPIARGIVIDGLYEPATHEAICANLPQGGVFLDLGANIGAISLPIARRRPDSSIFAVEASPRIAQVLESNAAANNEAKVTVLNTFIGEANEGAVDFFEAPVEKFGMGSSGPQFGVQAKSLPVRSIDALIEEGRLVPPDVIKLDIEGAEHSALRGCARLLSSARRPRAVIFEFADWAEERLGLAPGASQELMLGHGYRLYDLADPQTERREPLRQGGAMFLALS